jgi:hypothetical protein
MGAYLLLCYSVCSCTSALQHIPHIVCFGEQLHVLFVLWGCGAVSFHILFIFVHAKFSFVCVLNSGVPSGAVTANRDNIDVRSQNMQVPHNSVTAYSIFMGY